MRPCERLPRSGHPRPLLPLGSVPGIENIGLNVWVLRFAFGVSTTVGILFGLLPAVKSSKTDLQAGLKEGWGATGGRQRIQRVLVVVQIALALVLLTGGSLLLRTIHNLWAVNPGFDVQHVITFRVGLALAVMQPSADRVVFLFPTFERPSHRGGSIKHGNGAPALLCIAVYVCHLRPEQPVRLRADLMRCPVVDVQCARTAADDTGRPGLTSNTSGTSWHAPDRRGRVAPDGPMIPRLWRNDGKATRTPRAWMISPLPATSKNAPSAWMMTPDPRPVPKSRSPAGSISPSASGSLLRSAEAWKACTRPRPGLRLLLRAISNQTF
jgi:hypothetical protein